MNLKHSASSILLLLGWLGMRPCLAQSWVASTAPTQTWTSVACSADGLNVVAVNHDGGIYVSPDAGQKWRRADAPDEPWTSVASSADGARLVAVSDSGAVATSIDSGSTWHEAGAPTNTWWSAVAMSADGSNVLAAALHDSIYSSGDSGVSWLPTLAPTNQWSCLAGSADGGFRLAAADPGLIYVSLDSGMSWAAAGAPLLSWSTVASSANGAILFAGAQFGPLFSSTDYATTWTPTSAPTNEAWLAVACSSDGARVIAAGSLGGIYTSTNSGATWNRNRAPSNTRYSVCVSADGTKPFAAAYNGGIYIPGVPPAASTNAFAAGVYQGLFYETNGVSPDTAGFFSATITSRKTFSAKLQFASGKYSFAGPLPNFASESNASSFSFFTTNTVTRKGLRPLQVVLEFEPGSDQLRGSVGDGSWSAALAANRAFFSRTNPPPQAGGAYTFVLPVDTAVDTPTGFGYGTIRVGEAGNVTLRGVLADGSRVSQSAWLSRQNQWPFFASLYSGKGVLLGWLDLANGGDSDIDGLMDWIRPPQSRAKLYQAGFTNQVRALGSTFHLTYTLPVLNFSTGQVWFARGQLPSGDFTNSLVWKTNNTIRNLSPNKLTLRIGTLSGLFKGSVVNPATGKRMAFGGALLQRQNVGRGFFPGAGQSGSVYLEPNR
jgi:photosystem II stability/assembly factor-like uncharacterized protein